MPQTQPTTTQPTRRPRGKARRSTPEELDAFVTDPDLELADEIAEEAGRGVSALWRAGVVLAVLAVLGLRRRPGQSTLRWNPATFRYLTRDGRVVAVSGIRQSLEAVNKVMARRLSALGEELGAGKLTIGQFQKAAREELMAGHLLAGSLANGGRAHLSDSIIETIAFQVKQQLVFFDRLALELQARTLPVAGRLFQRLRQYAAAVRGTYYAVSTEAHKRAGFTEERNVLAVAEHCHADDELPGCVEETGRGWVAIGGLSNVGDRRCGGGCKCHLIYR